MEECTEALKEIADTYDEKIESIIFFIVEFYHRAESIRSLKCLEEENKIVQTIIEFKQMNNIPHEYFLLKKKIITSEIDVQG